MSVFVCLNQFTPHNGHAAFKSQNSDLYLLVSSYFKIATGVS